MPNRLFRTKELTELLGISRSTLYNWTASGLFPKPIKIGARAIAWSEPDIQDWITSKRNDPRNLEASEWD